MRELPSRRRLSAVIAGAGAGGGVARAGRSWVRSPQMRENLAGALFLTPWFAGLLFLTAGPMLASLYLSFTDFDLFTSPQWIGLANYVTMFTQDPRYLNSLITTFIYVGLSVPLQLAFALLLALALNRGIRAVGLFRAVFYLPSLIGGSVGVAVMWRQIFDTDGVFNRFLALFGLHGPGWIATPPYALYTLVLLAVWQFGSPMIIFLAGLKQIPHDLYEAAEVDGAGVLHRFLHVTIPMLTPIIFFNLVLQIIQSFQSFTSAFIVSDGTGGPADNTLFYTLYIYQEGFGYFKMGYAAAMAWVLLLIIAVFTAANFLMSRYWVFYRSEQG